MERWRGGEVERWREMYTDTRTHTQTHTHTHTHTRAGDSLERDRFMSPEEAVSFGLVDEVVASRKGAHETPKRKQSSKAKRD